MSSDIKLSKHLLLSELDCKDGTPYPDEYMILGRSSRLAVLFESIRSMWGLPITVLSAYRTVPHNKKVGGAPNSQHLLGLAMDLLPPKGVNLDTFYYNIKDNWISLDLGGLGKYQNFVHVDLRNSDHLITWFGPEG